VQPKVTDKATDKLNRRGTSFRVQGLTVTKPNHPEVKALRAEGHCPSRYATMVWGASYLLIDYLSGCQDCHTQQAMELGCGWGLVSHYLSSVRDCDVIATDIDDQVFPFVKLLGRLNQSRVDICQVSFAKLTQRALSQQLLVGADICYNEVIAEQLDQLFLHALDQGVGQILLADAGRPPFKAMAARWVRRGQAELVSHSIERPTRYQGYILSIQP